MSQIVKKPQTSSSHSLEKTIIILQAARNRFAHYGFSKVTMDEIAHDVGMVKGALYYYFPTKEKVFEAVIKEEHESFFKEIDDLFEQGLPTSEKLTRYVKLRLAYVRKLMNMAQLDFESWRNQHFQEIFQHFHRRECSLLQQLFDDGIRAGEFSITDTESHVRLFLRTVKGLKQLEYLYGQPGKGHSTDFEQDILLFTSIFLAGIQNNNRRHKKP
jgi:TetR/AcrR family transcriptional repressor of mexJK operon